MKKWSFYIASDIEPRSGYILADNADDALRLLGNNQDACVYPLPNDVALPEGNGPVWSLAK